MQVVVPQNMPVLIIKCQKQRRGIHVLIKYLNTTVIIRTYHKNSAVVKKKANNVNTPSGSNCNRNLAAG